ncbi:MAG: hypothetical protein WAO20_19015 [Acidobacteriota bacterium]
MRRYLGLVPATLLVAIAGWPLYGETRLNDCVVVLPQVAKGELIETTILFLNTSTTAVDVAVTATDERLLEPTEFDLGPFERREVKLEAEGELLKGAVRVASERTVLVEGRIRTRTDPQGDFTSQVTILAEPLHSEVVIPISYRTDFVDNTGFAFFYDAPGAVEIDIYSGEGDFIDNLGGLIGGMGSPVRHEAFFIDEVPGIATTLGDRFTGSLRVSFTGLALAATALYTRGSELWTARVQAVREAQSGFIVTLESGESRSILDELALQYGFTVSQIDSTGQAHIVCTDEVARALERDYRVASMSARSTSALP